MFVAITIAGIIASAIIVIAVQWGSVARTRLVCETDVELARITAGQTTTVNIRVARASKHHVSANLPTEDVAVHAAGGRQPVHRDRGDSAKQPISASAPRK